jgi:hypothetical protein
MHGGLSVKNADAHRARGAVNDVNDSNKEQSGAGAVKIPNLAGSYFNRPSPRDGDILNEPDRN